MQHMHSAYNHFGPLENLMRIFFLAKLGPKYSWLKSGGVQGSASKLGKYQETGHPNFSKGAEV